jgi:murein DD-endopeptidase MepM/ murein hydrolase activator NlpD
LLWHTINPHPGSFGYARKGSRHTGVDLYTDLGAEVRAVESGVVVGIEHFTGEWDASPWWNNTDCVMVKGISGVINYGEILPLVHIGEKISEGNLIGKVMRVIKEGRDHYEITGWRPTMLHLE